MDSIDWIRENLANSRDIVLSRIEDMRAHCMVPPTPSGGCHTLWLLGHLAFVETLVVQTFMLGNPNPLDHWKSLFDGDEISGESSSYPSFDILLAECRARRSATIELLESYEETTLDESSRKCPQNADELFGTYRRCFQYVSDHWLMHRGQFANARLAAGLPRMWY